MNDFIDYSNCQIDSRGVYCLSYSMIELAVEAYLWNHHPEILLRPQQTPIENWIEAGEYGFSLEYRSLAFPQAQGLTAFSKMAIWAISSETGNLEILPIEENTIVVDETLPENELRFTCCHEVMHTKMHPYYFLHHDNAIAANSNVVTLTSYMKNPIWWLERQANYGAGALLIPKQTLEILFKRELGVSKPFCLSRLEEQNIGLIRKISNIYNTSLTATKIRLQQLNLLEGD